MKHETKRVVLKEAEIDSGIVPLVQWLSSLEGVNTLYSCQGDESLSWSAYVCFTCSYRMSLLAVLKEIRDDYQNIRMEVDWYNDMLPVRYVLRFRMVDDCQKFQKMVQKRYAPFNIKSAE